MSKCSASHALAKSYFKMELISTASALDSSLQDGYISSEDPLYALLARNLSVVQSLQHCQPLHRRLKMPTNHLEHLRLTLLLNSTPDRFPSPFCFRRQDRPDVRFIGEPSGGTVAAFKARGRRGAEAQAWHRQTLRYSWFQTGSRCLGRLWSKVWAQFSRPLACQTPLNVQARVSLHSTHGGNSGGSRRRVSESERESERARDGRQAGVQEMRMQHWAVSSSNCTWQVCVAWVRTQTPSC